MMLMNKVKGRGEDGIRMKRTEVEYKRQQLILRNEM